MHGCESLSVIGIPMGRVCLRRSIHLSGREKAGHVYFSSTYANVLRIFELVLTPS